MKTEDLKNNKEYKYGFTTDIESIRAPKGLNEDTIKFISKIKKEPKWMLDWRLKAYSRLKVLKEPNWQKPKYPKINYQDLYYYSAPKSASEKPNSLDEIDPKILEILISLADFSKTYPPLAPLVLLTKLLSLSLINICSK